MHPQHRQALEDLAQRARTVLTEKFQAREEALRRSREALQRSALAIRAVHRQEWEKARALLTEARQALEGARALLAPYPDVLFAGFVEDAEKEFVEASLTLAFVAGEPLPTPEDLGVGLAPYLNGLGESVGELRRYILDALRRDDLTLCESLLEAMDEVYHLLVTLDFPDAMTGGLRRTTDLVRGVLERTRGDLTQAVCLRRLEEHLAGVEDLLRRGPLRPAEGAS